MIIMQPLTIFSCHASICQLIGGDVQMWGKGAPKSRPGFKESTSVPDFELHFFGIWNFSKLRTTKTWTWTGFDDFGVPKSHEKKHAISIPGNINNHSYLNYHDAHPSKIIIPIESQLSLSGANTPGRPEHCVARQATWGFTDLTATEHNQNMSTCRFTPFTLSS